MGCDGICYLKLLGLLILNSIFSLYLLLQNKTMLRGGYCWITQMMLIFVLSYLPSFLQADLFFYREPEESKEQQEEETAPAADYDYGAAAIAGASDQWGGQISDAQWAGDAVAPAIPAVPAVGWTPDAGGCCFAF